MSATEKLRIHLSANRYIQDGRKTYEARITDELLYDFQNAQDSEDQVRGFAHFARYGVATVPEARAATFIRMVIKAVAEDGWEPVEDLLNQWIISGETAIPREPQ